VPRVYVSLPLSGPSREPARELLRGVRLAAEPADAELVVADTTGGDERDALALAHARAAIADPEALAYLGDFHSSQVCATAPLLSQAEMLQVAPVATFAGRAAHERDSVIGRHSLDERGRVAGLPCGRIVVTSGELLWE
jgi:ABC-type branched-subunit amino acid transport system substrate-binding protein